MRTIALILWLSFLSLTTVGQGVYFENLSWEQAQLKSEETGQMIFVDVYTDWCVPCKWMNKNVFANYSTGSHHNSSFINIKLNAEQGKGILFSKKFNVESYPTFLFFDAQGKEIHRLVGKMELMEFLEESKLASNSGTSQFGMNQLFDQGQRGHSFLNTFLKSLNRGELPNGKVIDALWQQNGYSLSSKAGAEFVYNNLNDLNSDLFLKAVQNRYSLENIFSKAIVDDKFDRIIKRSIESATKQIDSDPSALATVQSRISQLFPGRTMDFEPVQLRKLHQNGEYQSFINKSLNYFKQRPQSRDFTLMALTVQSIIHRTSNPSNFEQGLHLAKKTLDGAFTEKNYKNYLSLLLLTNDTSTAQQEIPRFVSVLTNHNNLPNDWRDLQSTLTSYNKETKEKVDYEGQIVKQQERELKDWDEGILASRLRVRAEIAERREKERLARIERERLARLERERLAKLEEERLAKLEEERLARIEAERLARIERERLAKLEQERLAKLEEERLAKLEEERLARLEKERLARIESERLAKLEEERLAKLEKEQLAKLEKERLARVEKERLAKIEKERLAKLEEERLALLEKTD